MAQEHFADRLMAEIQGKRSQVVVGLDPRPERLPPGLLDEARERSGAPPRAVAEAFFAFNRAVIDAVAEHVVALKPQVAFYERFGVEGMRAYARTIEYARRQGLIVIGDVKRNDIGSTAAAYAAAHLGGDCQDFVADAVTVNPYLGVDGVRPFVDVAAEQGKGVFALVRTSNPSSVDLQELDAGGEPLFRRVAALVSEWGEAHRGESGYSLLGAVVGAPFPEQLRAARALMPHAPLLVPGFGAQGGGVEDVLGAFDEQGGGAVVSSSRGVIFAWERAPYAGRYGQDRWREAVRAAASDMRAELWSATRHG